MKNIFNIKDLQNVAKKRVPKMFYEYADSGSWTEETYKANQNDFSKIKFRQRVGVDIDNRSLKKNPVKIAPAESIINGIIIIIGDSCIFSISIFLLL